jgi:hypothetical protein
MVRNFKNRDKNMKLSVYVIHTRMLAQMTVIGELYSRGWLIYVIHDLAKATFNPR